MEYHHSNAGKTMETDKSPDKYRYILVDNVRYRTHLTTKFINRKVYEDKDPRKITAFIPGTVKKVFVQEGQRIRIGSRLLTLEAMKMNNVISSPMEGTVKKVNVKQGNTVAKNQVLIELE
jgi:biotin carboxyl carrier protein